MQGLHAGSHMKNEDMGESLKEGRSVIGFLSYIEKKSWKHWTTWFRDCFGEKSDSSGVVRV
jgi:hypothetical protein